MKRADCALCAPLDEWAGGLVTETPLLRVIRVLDAPDFPAFYRVIWRDHIAEFSDLDADARRHCMEAVVAVETGLRTLSPTKINLAALGNVVPHLHWHVIARFDWDSHFPQPIWGSRQREVPAEKLDAVSQRLGALDTALHLAIRALGFLPGVHHFGDKI